MFLMRERSFSKYVGDKVQRPMSRIVLDFAVSRFHTDADRNRVKCSFSDVSAMACTSIRDPEIRSEAFEGCPLPRLQFGALIGRLLAETLVGAKRQMPFEISRAVQFFSIAGFWLRLRPLRCAISFPSPTPTSPVPQTDGRTSTIACPAAVPRYPSSPLSSQATRYRDLPNSAIANPADSIP